MRRNCLARVASALAATLALAACGSLQHTQPVAARLASGVRLQSALPDQRPSGTLPVADKAVLWVPMHGTAHAAISQLVPVPFLSEAVDAVADRAEGRSLAWLQDALDPQDAARGAMLQAGLLAPAGQTVAPDLSVYVVAQDCVDDRVRIALVGQLADDDAKAALLARYIVHLPTAWPRDELPVRPAASAPPRPCAPRWTRPLSTWPNWCSGRATAV